MLLSRLLALALAAAAVSPGPSVSQMPPVPAPPMQADDGPTAYACTLDKLGHGDACAYEGKQDPPLPNQARLNSQAAQAAARGCDLEDGSAARECELGIQRVSQTRACTLQGRARLVDDEGRLTAASSRCVEALLAVFNHAGKLADATTAACCQCVAAARCGVPAEDCSSEVLELKPGRKLSTCAQRSCAAECSFLPHAPEPAHAGEDAAPAASEPKLQPAGKPNKI